MLRKLELVIVLGLSALLLRERGCRRRAERFAAAGLESLLRAIDANDPQTGAHVRRVATYSLILADAVGLDSEQRRVVELAALFHDVGKVHRAFFDLVHESRLLTPAERRAIASHPARGAEVLAPIGQFHPQLAHAVLAHHERWDGSGYPSGLAGTAIPIASRIVAIADAFDVVTYGRRYQLGVNSGKAAEVMLQGRGTQFDPQLVDLLLFPPVFARVSRALTKACRQGDRVPSRRRRHKSERAPKITIRWRTRTDPSAPVRMALRKAGRIG